MPLFSAKWCTTLLLLSGSYESGRVLNYGACGCAGLQSIAVSVNPMFCESSDRYRDFLRFMRNLRHRVANMSVKKAFDTFEQLLRNGSRNLVCTGSFDALQASFDVANVRFRAVRERRTQGRLDRPRQVASPAYAVYTWQRCRAENAHRKSTM
ncbi:hypothetical protein DDE05_40515 [Streptomyces cavourensis]|nr:hypothetical protein DDE05_40515 [Streptomyces cavourensis]